MHSILFYSVSSFFLLCSILSLIVVHYARDCSCTCMCTCTFMVFTSFIPGLPNRGMSIYTFHNCPLCSHHMSIFLSSRKLEARLRPLKPEQRACRECAFDGKDAFVWDSESLSVCHSCLQDAWQRHQPCCRYSSLSLASLSNVYSLRLHFVKTC